MNSQKYGIFATIKSLDEYISVYKTIYEFLKGKGLVAYQPWLVKEYPLEKHVLESKAKSIARGTNKQVRSIDFAIAEFSTKSRTVFYQTIMALESKVPVLILVKDDKMENVPKVLHPYEKDFLTIKKYHELSDIEDILEEYTEELDPPKKRFNVVLKTNTLKHMEQLCKELEISKAELIRRLITKEFKRIFDGK